MHVRIIMMERLASEVTESAEKKKKKISALNYFKYLNYNSHKYNKKKINELPTLGCLPLVSIEQYTNQQFDQICRCPEEIVLLTTGQ